MVELRHLIGRATQLHQAGRFAEAEPLYAQALELYPGNYPALHLLGLLRLQQQKIPEAIALMEQALKVQPKAPETLTNYGMALKAAGRYREALAAMDREAAFRPPNARSITNRGTVLVRLGWTSEAIREFERAAALDRGNPEILSNWALALLGERRLEEAAAIFGRVLALRPRDIESWNNRGNCWREMNAPIAALADYDRALALAPRNSGILLNRANTLMVLGRMDDALACCEMLLKDHPDLVAGRVARAGIFERKGLLRAAIADLEKAKRISPDYPYLEGRLLHLKVAAGDWSDFARSKAMLDAAIRAGRPAAEPFIYHALSDSLDDLQICARYFTADRFPARPPLALKKPRKPGPIRLGYMAGEFHQHATTLLAIGLFERHDRKRFELFAFDNGGSDGSPMRARFEAAIPQIIPIAGLSDQEAARRVAAAGIDILVNLNGHVGLQRTGVFAQRPAPIQVSYLGFPGTMGAPYMDYILADAELIAGGEERYYDEKVVRLPGSYQINDDRQPLPERVTRAAHGLPEQAFVFGQFNAAYKTTPDLFAIWMRLLAKTEAGILWLLADNEECAGNLRAAAAAQGIDPYRLIFAPKLPHQDHVARLPLADLLLDTAPCSAHTIASEALWAGVPILTCRGNSFAGRVAASLLRAADLSELITNDLPAYEAQALALAHDPGRIGELRARLIKNRGTCALFDTAATTHHIETAFSIMFEREQAGLAPESIHVLPTAQTDM